MDVIAIRQEGRFPPAADTSIRFCFQEKGGLHISSLGGDKGRLASFATFFANCVR